MRVIHILDHSIPHPTRYAARTMAILAAQRERGWETFQLTGPNQGGGSATEEDVEGWRFHRSPPPGGLLEGLPGIAALEFMGEIAHRVERLALRVRPHVLHAHSPVVNAIPALRVGRRLGLPVVYEVRPPEEDVAGAVLRPLPVALTRLLETWVLRRADAVTTACESARGAALVRGVSPSKITLIAAPPAAGDEYCRVYEHLMGAT